MNKITINARTLGTVHTHTHTHTHKCFRGYLSYAKKLKEKNNIIKTYEFYDAFDDVSFDILKDIA